MSLDESFGTDIHRQDGSARDVLQVHDVDLYKLDATSAGRLLIDIDAVADSDGKTKATLLRVFDSRGDEIGIDNANSYAQNISETVIESEEASHLGSFLSIEISEDQTYYIGVSQLAAQQDYNPNKIDGRSTNSTVNEGSYQIHIDYQPNFSTILTLMDTLEQLRLPS